MIAVHFNKELVAQFLDAIQTGKPIHCEWNGRNMLALAGTLFFAVLTQGPHRMQLPGAPKMKDLHPERQEAVEEEFFQNIHDAIEYVSKLAMMVKDGEYDACFEPEHQAVIYRKDGERTAKMVKGFKSPNDSI